MNKKNLSIAMVVVLGVCLLLLTGCFTKTALTAESFEELMKAEGYVVSNLTDQYEEGLVKNVLVAMDTTNDYQIEFFEQNSDADARVSFNMNVETMEENKGSMSSSTSFTGQNYEKQTMFSNGEYWVVSRIDNTVVFAHVSENNKDLAKAIIEKIGY